MRTILAVTLAALIGTTPVMARTQSQTVALPPGGMGQFVKGLKLGTPVVLKLTSGAKVKGTLIATEDDAVTVKPRTRVPEPARRIALDQIADADVASGASVGKAVAIGAAVGAGAALSFLFLLIAAYGSD